MLKLSHAAPSDIAPILSGLAGLCNEFSIVGIDREGKGRGGEGWGGGAYMGC